MNQKVQDFIEQKTKERIAAKEEEKHAFLDKHGLYTAVYTEEKPSDYAFTVEEKKSILFLNGILMDKQSGIRKFLTK